MARTRFDDYHGRQYLQHSPRKLTNNTRRFVLHHGQEKSIVSDEKATIWLIQLKYPLYKRKQCAL